MASCASHNGAPNSTSWRRRWPYAELISFAGIAFFPDGSIGTTLVIGTSDVTSGVGATINGYYTVNFADGSTLWFKYTGTTKPPTAKGTAIVIGGKGRYAGAKGEGTFEGASTSGPDA